MPGLADWENLDRHCDFTILLEENLACFERTRHNMAGLKPYMW